MKYNDDDEHECTPDVYERACCGTNYQQNPVFSMNKRSIQLQIFSDEFEPCDPLKTKAGIHKTTAFYFQIKYLFTSIVQF